ncbi:unnamed protein product [Diatraea saccharalis]|uniref:Insulin-like domain-containing protein n=1 Tax=Diatraea saccharalis TaxID=40085 RepID=A0A9N9RCA6_9NEOP|nr:unnamed protein product [Diatraea saccharalis]
MEGKYIYFIAFVVTCSHDMGQAHILPFTHSHDKVPMHECIKELTRSMINLCSIYGDYSSELLLDNGMSLIPREVTNRSWDIREKVIKNCCMRPCSASELLAIC